MPLRILVPRLVDAGNDNPQSLNVKAMLRRFSHSQCRWTAAFYDDPDIDVARSPNVNLVRMWRRRFWEWRMFLLYQQAADAVFYPGFYWFDRCALQLRKISRRKIPIIATLEGIGGDEETQRLCSEWAGHRVYCSIASGKLLTASVKGLREADHIIAISPFLGRLGARLYGNKICVLPLGIDTKIFNPNGRRAPETFTAIGAGRLYENKQPHLFLEMAERFPNANFVWYGEGEQRQVMLQERSRRGLSNVDYPGTLPHKQLADELRRASLFILPSLSEGVPKVVQEAAACGLPVIVFGFYETPSVRDGENGYVVWNEEQLFQRVAELSKDPDTARRLGQRGAEMAIDWGWDQIAPLWEAKITELLGRSSKSL